MVSAAFLRIWKLISRDQLFWYSHQKRSDYQQIRLRSVCRGHILNSAAHSVCHYRPLIRYLTTAMATFRRLILLLRQLNQLEILDEYDAVLREHWITRWYIRWRLRWSLEPRGPLSHRAASVTRREEVGSQNKVHLCTFSDDPVQMGTQEWAVFLMQEKPSHRIYSPVGWRLKAPLLWIPFHFHSRCVP